MSSSSSPITSTASNDNSNSETIQSSYLISLYNLGFKLVPLSENHIPAIKEWSPIYDNPDYWHKDKFNDPTEHSKFTNVASTVGITHIKDSAENKDLYLQVLDIDSEFVYDIISKPISQLINSSDIFEPFMQEVLKSIGITNESHLTQSTILDIVKVIHLLQRPKKHTDIIYGGYHIIQTNLYQLTIARKDARLR